VAILTVNVGSSSVRLVVFSDAGLPIASAHYPGQPSAQQLLSEFQGANPGVKLTAIGHRIVHGGTRLLAACRIDPTVEAQIETLGTLAPLHNPPALAWLRACRAVFGDAMAQVAVFDTAFYSQLPDVARHYALPQTLSRALGLRRYGFHGLAHQSMWRQWSAQSSAPAHAGRVISLQLGAGCSITAVLDGRAIDTSMGYSPLEGLVMATRAGDIDAGLLLHLQRHGGYSLPQLETLLNEHSGLLGLSGLSGDLRVLLASHDPLARLAVDLYCYRVRKYLGAYMAALGGVDVILFGGGVGEHLPAIRERILADMSWCAIALDEQLNCAVLGRSARISAAGSAVAVWVMLVDEAALIMAETRSVLGS
jgi:acetate kinase